MEEKVSIIIPAYNVESYIDETLQSVEKQTYQNWECIIADDGSTDRTAKIIMQYTTKDARFRYIRLESNKGAAAARNAAIAQADGKYMAFLDADDIWDRRKLEIQIAYMKANGYLFTCTDYGKIDQNGTVQKRVSQAEAQYDYNKILKKCPGNSTIVYDCGRLGKIYGEDIRRRNDFAMWLKVIKKAGSAYGLKGVYTYHREREDSISIKKTKLLKYQWKVYRDIEKLSMVQCLYYMLCKVAQALYVKVRY